MALLDNLESAEEILAREESTLWSCEKEIRVRCDALTPLEISGLRRNPTWAGHIQCVNDAEKVQTFFGLASGGTAACKRLLKWCMEQNPSRPGLQVNFRDVQFTLGKHLLLAERRQRQKEDLPPNMLACKCFAATYVMPGGCVHQKIPLWKAPVLQTTLCPTCSVCLRCGKFPALVWLLWL